MTIFKTNAQSLDELDIAWAELQALSSIEDTAMYMGRGEFSANHIEILQRSLDRLAMFDSAEGLIGEDWPTAWAKIRAERPNKIQDHSTHNLWAFTGKIEPRLARACINLAVGMRDKATICDPFCGSGTIPLEADLMGFRHIENDLDPFAVWLTRTKLNPSSEDFRRDYLKLFGIGSALLEAQRAASPPVGNGKIDNTDALTFLNHTPDKPVEAIVTSPPYYDAIDYNENHAVERKFLGLEPPRAPSLGISQTVSDYRDEVRDIAKAMVGCLVPQGRVAIVSASYRGVDTPAMYESSLREGGMRLLWKLKRPYKSPTLGIQEDIILVMEKL